MGGEVVLNPCTSLVSGSVRFILHLASKISSWTSVTRRMQQPLTIIDIDAFETVYGTFVVPKGTVFFRGHSGKTPAVSNWPMYFASNPYTAQQYADVAAQGVMSTCVTTKDLRVFDLRYMGLVLRDIISRRKDPCPDSDSAAEFIAVLEKVMLAYGTCSLDAQIRLLRKEFKIPANIELTSLNKGRPELNPYRKMGELQAQCAAGTPPCWVNPVEPQGVRLGHSDVDMDAVLFMMHVFSDVVDGYVAPKLESPFQTSGKINSEFCVFNPAGMGIQPVDSQTLSTRTVPIGEILSGCKAIQHYRIDNQEVLSWRQRGGRKRNAANRRRDPAELYITNKRRVQDAAERGKRVAEGLKFESRNAFPVQTRKNPLQVGGRGPTGGHP